MKSPTTPASTGRATTRMSSSWIAIRQPNRREPGRPPREIVNRVYSDTVTGETMLLRAVIEETESEIAVITLYKISKLKKYLPKETP